MGKAKTGALRPHESFFDKGLTTENKDEDNFFQLTSSQLSFYFYKFAWKIVTQGNYSPIILKTQKLCISHDVVDLSL